MWYYLPEWLKWWKGRPKPPVLTEDQSLSEMIKRRAIEQEAVIERKETELLPDPVGDE
jgi:hypothetical protein